MLSSVKGSLTGQAPPTIPPTAAQYTNAGLPWFDHYSENPAVDGSESLAGLKTVKDLSKEKGEAVLPENESVAVKTVPLVQMLWVQKKAQVIEPFLMM